MANGPHYNGQFRASERTKGMLSVLSDNFHSDVIKVRRKKFGEFDLPSTRVAFPLTEKDTRSARLPRRALSVSHSSENSINNLVSKAGRRVASRIRIRDSAQRRASRKFYGLERTIIEEARFMAFNDIYGLSLWLRSSTPAWMKRAVDRNTRT